MRFGLFIENKRLYYKDKLCIIKEDSTMNNKEFKRNFLSEFIYKYGKNHKLDLKIPFFSLSYTVPYVGYEYDDSITNEIKKNAVKEGVVNDSKKLVAVMTDFSIGDKGIYFTDEEIIVHTSRNKPKDFRLKYYDVDRMIYYSKIDTLSIFDRSGKNYDINIDSFDKNGIKIILKVACGFVDFFGDEIEKISNIKLNMLKGYSITELMKGRMYFNKENFFGEWKLCPTYKRYDMLYDCMYSATEIVVDRCLNILERDRYFVDELPFNTRIKKLLVDGTGMFYMHGISVENKPKYDLKRYGEGFIFRKTNCIIKEPSASNWSKEPFIEYGYISAALKIVPDFVNLILNMAVTLDNKTNKLKDQDRVLDDLCVSIENLQNENKLLEDKLEKLNDEFAKVAGKNHSSLITSGASGSFNQGNGFGRSIATGVSTALKTRGVGCVALIPISAFFVYSTLSSRKKKYILAGKDEAFEYFGQIFNELSKRFMKFEKDSDEVIRKNIDVIDDVKEIYYEMIAKKFELELNIKKLRAIIKEISYE